MMSPKKPACSLPVGDLEALAGAMLRMLDTAADYDPQRIRD